MNELHFQPIGAALGEGAAIRIGRCTEETPAGETHIYFEPCESVKSVRVSQSLPDSEGRMLDVTLTVQNVCPGRRVFIGLSAHEVMEGGAEELRGFRALSLPAHHDGSAHAVDAPPIRFILPEEENVDSRAGRPRHFVLRAYAHYADQAGCEST